MSDRIESKPTFEDIEVTANAAANAALVRKQDMRLVPLCALMYLLAYLDRSNIGNAKIMNADQEKDLLTITGTSSYQYSIALAVFLVAYTIFEIPANFFLKMIGPSKWFCLLMISWGTVASCMGVIENFGGLMATRFILGIFEAGLAPGLAYYITFWYRANERSIRLAFIYSTATLAGAFGGALAYGISHLNMTRGLEGWRWLFIIEGLPSVVCAFIVLFFLPDYPEKSRFLNEEERQLAMARMEFNGSKGTAGNMSWAQARETLYDLRLYAHYIVYFSKSCPFSSLSLFTPSIVSGLGYSSVQAQLMTVPPYAAAAIPPDRYVARYICLIICCSGTFATIPILLGWLSANLHSTSAQGLAIALTISFGAPGQITGTWIYQDEEKARGYPTGHWVNGALLLVGATLTAGLVLLVGFLGRKHTIYI
ncbi:hypothetical protein BDV12DRAFT_211025 [Aspergillus spectabilis]